MNLTFLTTILCIVLTSPLGRSAVIAGAFDWNSDSSALAGTASFTYDADTGIGYIEGLHPGSGAWVSPGYWRFSLQVAGVNLFSSKVVISSFSDLTDFSSREILVMPPSTLENPATPYVVNGQLQWRLRQGQAYGVIDAEWFTSDAAIPSPTFGTGTTSNFVEVIPEPQTYMCTALGAFLLSTRRVRCQKKKHDFKSNPLRRMEIWVQKGEGG
jgi:hypothetical protein